MNKWEKEPDFHEFTFKNYGCFIRRNTVGTWCGYVAIPQGHKFYRSPEYDKYVDIDVHGGITFAEKVVDTDTGEAFILIGFDCCHLGDLLPIENSEEGILARLNIILFEDLEDKEIKTTYKDMQFAMKECRKIVRQISKE